MKQLITKNLVVALICLCCGLLILPSCDKISDSDTEVMVILKNQIDYWETVRTGVVRAANEMGTGCDIRWTDADADAQSQIDAIDDYIDHKSDYSGLAIAPINAIVCDYLAEKLNSDSKPLVIIDTPVPENNLLKYNIYIGTNNFEAGAAIAKKALGDIKDILTKKVLVFTLPAGTSMLQRAEGIVSVIPNATVLDIPEEEDEAIPEIIKAVSEADVLFGTNMATSTSLAKAIYEKKISALPLYCFDNGDFELARVSDGTICGTMVQKSEEMGYFAVQQILYPTDGKTNATKYLDTDYLTK